jgi:small subunit ribosomal protein S6
MNQYEVMYIIDTQLEEAARQDLVARFSALVEQNGGTIDRVDEWGKRRLAYSINYKTEGYYVLMYITAPPELPRELERNLQISEFVLRYLVTRFEGELPPKREALRPFTPAAPRAEGAPAQAAPAQAAPAQAAPAQAAPAQAAPAQAAPAQAAPAQAAPAAEEKAQDSEEDKIEPVAEV